MGRKKMWLWFLAVLPIAIVVVLFVSGGPKQWIGEGEARDFLGDQSIRAEANKYPDEGVLLGDVIKVEIRVVYRNDLIDFERLTLESLSFLPLWTKNAEITENNYNNKVSEVRAIYLLQPLALMPGEYQLADIILPCASLKDGESHQLTLKLKPLFVTSLVPPSEIEPRPIQENMPFKSWAWLFICFGAMFLAGGAFLVFRWTKRHQKREKKSIFPKHFLVFRESYRELKNVAFKEDGLREIAKKIYFLVRVFFVEETNIEWLDFISGKEKPESELGILVGVVVEECNAFFRHDGVGDEMINKVFLEVEKLLGYCETMYELRLKKPSSPNGIIKRLKKIPAKLLKKGGK